MSQEPNEIPVRRTRLRDLPPGVAASAAPAAVDPGIWNRTDRPKLVGVVGWITTAVGYLSFTLKGGGLVRYFSDMKWLNPEYVAPVLTRGQYASEVLLTLADIAVGLLAITAGLGALKMREWGRRCLVYYAIAALVISVLKAIYQFTNFDSAFARAMAATQPVADRATVENREFFFFITSTAMMAVWPLLVWWIATRPYVRRAYDRANGVPVVDDGWRSTDA